MLYIYSYIIIYIYIAILCWTLRHYYQWGLETILQKNKNTEEKIRFVRHDNGDPEQAMGSIFA